MLHRNSSDIGFLTEVASRIASKSRKYNKLYYIAEKKVAAQCSSFVVKLKNGTIAATNLLFLYVYYESLLTSHLLINYREASTFETPFSCMS